MLFLGLRSPSSSSAVIAPSPQSRLCLPPSRSCLLLLFILDFQALLNHFGCFKITMPSLLFLFLSFVLLELSSSNLPLRLGVRTRAHPSWKPPCMGTLRLPCCRAPPLNTTLVHLCELEHTIFTTSWGQPTVPGGGHMSE